MHDIKSLTYFMMAFCVLCPPIPALATDNKVSTDQTPLEITANTALEWDQNAKTYTARGNALAKQGNMSIAADTLVALYDDAKGQANNITKLEAIGHVTLISGDDKAVADKATYDLITGQSELTGQRPKIIRANNDSLEADMITLWTTKAGNGPTKLDKAEANGNVLINNGQQKITGDKSKYTVSTNTAEMFGNVKIEQDKNWLSGDYADMNLTTHISHIKTSDGKKQVKGLFYTQTSHATPVPLVTEKGKSHE